MGRGGRIVLDRASVPGADDRLWRSLDFTIINGIGGGGGGGNSAPTAEEDDENGSMADWPHFRPVTPPHCQEDEERLQFPPPPSVMQLSRQVTAAGAALPQQQSGGLSNGLGTRTLNSVAAHNTASAVVTKKELEIFSVGLPAGQQQQQQQHQGVL